MTAKAREANKKRAREERTISGKKSWETRRANQAKKNSLFFS